MQDNGFLNTFSKVEPINKGWSEDKKYCVTKADGTKYLLRVTPIARYETRKALFEILQRVAALGIPMCQPIEFGTCEDGVYALHSWIDGEDAEKAISHMTETEQYLLGLKSGEILRKIHSIPAPEVNSNGLTLEEWEPRFNHKTNIKIQKYRECGLHFVGDDKIIEYIENNRHLLGNRPQSFQHGDYHIGNMMLENGELRIIDFDRFDFGDPWEEFNRIVWCAATSPHFATGQLRGYFGGEPPLEFFKLLAFYISSNTLSSIYWAIPFGQSEIDTMMKQSQDVLTWYDNMLNPVPTWYIKNLELASFRETDKERQARIYPIILSEYNPAWSEWYAEEKANLERLVGIENIARISHFGSTSVPGLTAKPTIDILLEISEATDIDKLITSLSSPYYIYLKEESAPTILTPPLHLMFLKGYLSDGFAEKVYHIHVVRPGDWDERLLFKDYLIAHPETAAEYALLKRELFEKFEFDRDGYTAAKGAFIKEITDKAKMIAHYDALIDENNDPVHDPTPLKMHMDKWDGAALIEALQLKPDKSVLEIGVGTGRLAVRVCGNCNRFTGIDISPKTTERAKENLQDFNNTSILNGNFLTYSFNESFDIIYSSLTFMHIEDKRAAIQRIASLLKTGGRFVLSISKNQQNEIDFGNRKITLYSDTPEQITTFITEADLIIEKQFETEFAVIFTARKGGLHYES